jgi:hypothetical protein
VKKKTYEVKQKIKKLDGQTTMLFLPTPHKILNMCKANPKAS